MTSRMMMIAALAVCLATETASADPIDWSFANTNPITINHFGIATPYPATIDVSGIVDPIENITVTLNGLSHAFPDDMGAVVVAPSGTAVLLFSGAGDDTSATDLTWVFDDNAAAELPMEGALASGTYQPGVEQWDEFFPAPGPGGKINDDDPAPWGFEFAPWKSEDPNGTWNLFVQDSNFGDAGQISGGWSITFTVNAVPEPGSMVLLLPALVGGFLRRRRDT